jgi:hypothetical protein
MSPSFFDNHKNKTCENKKKSVCESVRHCGSCYGAIRLEDRIHECGKRYCANCKQNMEIGHVCYMQPLKNDVPLGDGVLYVY